LAERDANVTSSTVAGRSGGLDPAHVADGRAPYERDLDDAVYYLEHGCEPCAQRHFDRARRHGASESAIETARARARIG
jgi:hypothetical protein